MKYSIGKTALPYGTRPVAVHRFTPLAYDTIQRNSCQGFLASESEKRPEIRTQSGRGTAASPGNGRGTDPKPGRAGGRGRPEKTRPAGPEAGYRIEKRFGASAGTPNRSMNFSKKREAEPKNGKPNSGVSRVLYRIRARSARGRRAEPDPLLRRRMRRDPRRRTKFWKNGSFAPHTHARSPFPISFLCAPRTPSAARSRRGFPK